MQSSHLDIQTTDGTMGCTLLRPEGETPLPAVLFFCDAMGVRPAMLEMAGRVAAQGYAVFVPNLLYRAGDFAPFDPKTVWSDDKERARLMGVMGTVKPPGTLQDIALLLDTVTARADVKKGGVATMGYCMGGNYAFRAAAAEPARVVATAALHAGNLVTDAPDSPHRSAGAVKARLYFGCADNDRSCTAEHRAALEATLKEHGLRYTLDFFPGAAHGFAVPDTPAFHADAARRHEERVDALLREAFSASFVSG